MKDYRDNPAWKDHTPPDLWPFDNPVYTVDATYLYTYSGSNARILAESYSLSKSTNLVKILSFTFLDGIPFWISKVYAGNVSDQDICEIELSDNEELLNFIRGSSAQTFSAPPPSISGGQLDPSSFDLEHILNAVPVENCTKRPIGIYDRGFNQQKLTSQFSILVTLPDYLHSRLSLTDEESLFSAFLSSRRVVIENYHGRVKTFHGLRFKLDMRVAVKYGRDLWLAATFLSFRNYAPLRASENAEDILLSTNDKVYESFLSGLCSTSESSSPGPSSSDSDEFVVAEGRSPSSDDYSSNSSEEVEFAIDPDEAAPFDALLDAIKSQSQLDKFRVSQGANLFIPKASQAELFTKIFPKVPEGIQGMFFFPITRIFFTINNFPDFLQFFCQNKFAQKIPKILIVIL